MVREDFDPAGYGEDYLEVKEGDTVQGSAQSTLLARSAQTVHMTLTDLAHFADLVTVEDL